ncbi:MAG: sigma-54-dependent Fis family transcriptional regulator [Oligoflexia bacterium]|nr:MAG: sigma-54-dependent Fis family transcriptional regulator [Oligoflexia bacterium]
MNSNTAFYLLVIDDDNLVIQSLKTLLPKNWEMTSFQSPPANLKSTLYHAAFVDMHLTKNLNHAEGPEIIKRISQENPKIETVAISGDLSLELMEQCLTNGAKKFLAKPLIPDEVISTLEKIEALWQLREAETRGGKNYRWVGHSPTSDVIKKTIASLRGESGPLLIEGETGTGKEVAFRLLNQQEINRPAITVNIASIPENLFESELFGHVKGAFTGADTNKIGLCEAAHGGDLFLDEIEALPLSQQVKLLRFLETGEVRKVGAKEAITVKTRVIAATNQNLNQLVKEGKFREDLLFRLNGKKIVLPPLRSRAEDIPDLALFFLSLQKPRVNKSFSPDALLALQNYSWPGNVRELKRICEQVCLTSPLPIIRREDVVRLLDSQQAGSLPAGAVEFQLGLTKLVEKYEAHVIQLALEKEKDVEKAAELLQISRSTIYKKIKDYDLQESE